MTTLSLTKLTVVCVKLLVFKYDDPKPTLPVASLPDFGRSIPDSIFLRFEPCPINWDLWLEKLCLAVKSFMFLSVLIFYTLGVSCSPWLLLGADFFS